VPFPWRIATSACRRFERLVSDSGPGLEAPLRSGQATPAIRDQLEASFVEFGDVARAVDQSKIPVGFEGTKLGGPEISKLEGLVVFTGVAEDLGDRGEPVVAAPVLAPTGDAGRRA